MRSLLLPDVVRGLVMRAGLTAATVAPKAGVSAGAIAALLTRIPSTLETWLRLIGAFDARVIITSGEESWSITIPSVAAPVRKRGQQSWRQKQYLSYLHAIAAQHASLKRSERESRARQYVIHEEERLEQGLPAARERMHQITVSGEQPGLRHALQALTTAAHISHDQLAWMTGVGLGAVTMALTAQEDGRLTTLRQVLAALNARLMIRLNTDHLVPIARMAHIQAAQPPAVPLMGTVIPKKSTHKQLSRSTLSHAAILQLYDAGTPITVIAKQAGVSRQRIHTLAKMSGRTMRRTLGQLQRQSDGLQLLSS